MLTNLTWRKRAVEREYAAEIDNPDREVDFGLELRVVVADPKGDVEFDDGRMLRVVRTHRFGGIVDTALERPEIIRPSECPQVWLCSEDQEAVLLHFEHPNGKPAQMVQGSEGGGKSTILAMWHWLMVLEHLGEHREGLQTAPTHKRLGAIKKEIQKLWRPSWYKFVNRREFEGIEVVEGSSIRMVSTHRQSEAQGSPLQSFNSSWAAEDEGQDSVIEHDHVTARLRAARGGAFKAPRIKTASSKDNSDWRTLRDSLELTGLWVRRSLIGTRTPFIPPEHWEGMKSQMSEREYKRRVLALDLPPETAVYSDWSREENLVAIPEIGWTDVTQNELRGSGPNLALLVGHDPGLTKDVSIFLRAYVRNQDIVAYQRDQVRCMWVAIGECNTEGTTEAHITKLLETVRERWGLNYLDRHGRPSADSPQILVRADPAGNSDNRTDKTVYTQFANAGIRIKPGAYNAENDGHGRVPREAGVELVNTLIRNAAGQRRFFVARNADGAPAAPMLVKAIESSERDDAGKAEVHRKGKGDLTHWPAALRYALWAIERPRLKLMHREEV